jgi:glycerol-3-phosphate dehydrogenase
VADKQIIIIGGGVVGCATAHDLTLRGVGVTVIERGEIASGTTGRCSCYIHSGARYAAYDPAAAVECIEENQILKRILPANIYESNETAFVLLEGDDLEYGDRFFEGCSESGIPVLEITPRELYSREPNLSPGIHRAALDPGVIIDPLKLALSYAATAQIHGAKFLRYTEVKEIIYKGGRATGVIVNDRVLNETKKIYGDLIINASGPWSAKVASLVGIEIPLSLSPGIHVILGIRLTHRPIHRMNLPSSGDFVAPLRNQTIVGTSSWTVQDCDYLHIPEDHIRQMRELGSALVPLSGTLPHIAVNAASRALISKPGASERMLSRTFACFDHAGRDNIEGFITLTGGKMVTARAMAEKVSNLVCKRFGVANPCQTASYQLSSFRRLL